MTRGLEEENLSDRHNAESRDFASSEMKPTGPRRTLVTSRVSRSEIGCHCAWPLCLMETVSFLHSSSTSIVGFSCEKPTTMFCYFTTLSYPHE